MSTGPDSTSQAVARQWWQRVAQMWNWLTFLAALVALVLQFALPPPIPMGEMHRLGQLVEYFTVDTLLLLTVSTGLLAMGIGLGRTAIRELRFIAIAAVCTMTVVYATLLGGQAGQNSFHGLTDHALPHYAIPLLAVTGWAVFGPRGWVSRRAVVASVAWPIGWFVVALLRGSLSGYYPYAFMDLRVLGYVHVLANILVVLAIVLGVAAAGFLLDSRFGQPGLPLMPQCDPGCRLPEGQR
jgi:hypothetical protein